MTSVPAVRSRRTQATLECFVVDTQTYQDNRNKLSQTDSVEHCDQIVQARFTADRFSQTSVDTELRDCCIQTDATSSSTCAQTAYAASLATSTASTQSCSPSPTTTASSSGTPATRDSQTDDVLVTTRELLVPFFKLLQERCDGLQPAWNRHCRVHRLRMDPSEVSTSLIKDFLDDFTFQNLSHAPSPKAGASCPLPAPAKLEQPAPARTTPTLEPTSTPTASTMVGAFKIVRTFGKEIVFLEPTSHPSTCSKDFFVRSSNRPVPLPAPKELFRFSLQRDGSRHCAVDLVPLSMAETQAEHHHLSDFLSERVKQALAAPAKQAPWWRPRTSHRGQPPEESADAAAASA